MGDFQQSNAKKKTKQQQQKDKQNKKNKNCTQAGRSKTSRSPSQPLIVSLRIHNAPDKGTSEITLCDELLTIVCEVIGFLF